MKGIYKMLIDCGRQGKLESVFVADSEDIKRLTGRYVNFGEALGKHSEIAGNMEGNEIVFITSSKEAISIFEQFDISTGPNPFHYLRSTGPNPLHYLRCECGEEIDIHEDKCRDCREEE